MKGVRSRLASLVCGLIAGLLPPKLQGWADAIRIEVSEIENDTQALIYALDSLWSLAWRFVAFHALRIAGAIAGPERPSYEGPASLMHLDRWQTTPRAVGVLCAVGATALGLAFMIMGGAPLAYLAVNSSALVVGLLLLASLNPSGANSDRWLGLMVLAAGLSLAATALFGLQVEGATRWVKLGPMPLQPGLVLTPMMIIAFVGLRSATAAFGLMAAAFALALQPDRAMSATLAAGMLALVLSRRDPLTVLVTIVSITGFAVTLLRPDTGQAVPFVDQVIFAAFDVHVLAGLAVAGGLALLMLPALAGLRFRGALREASLAFSAVWATVVAAAALGNYPTPLVGYSGAAILGYVLSLAMLPKVDATPEAKGARSDPDSANDLGSDATFSLGSAG
jgi:hypothetical protein